MTRTVPGTVRVTETARGLMRIIQPYKTLLGAMRALDNGGRFYNLFTSSGDQVVTAAELKKVAGVFRDDLAAALFLALATSELDGTEQRRVIQALGPKARAMHQRHRPAQLEPAPRRAPATGPSNLDSLK